ncbi:MAG TPA: hypothetical protein PL124_01490 [Candidatus Cloacimonadota bacterium]|nr:hypothetical protein [Candidatus Cloacimonadota bacterium]
MLPKPLLSWKSVPFIERPYTTMALVSFLLLLSVLLYKITIMQWHTPFYYVIGMLLVIINLTPYFITTEYAMFEHEIVIKYAFMRITRKYADFGCFYKDKRGIMLSTFKLPRRLDSFRGQSLRFSKSQEEVPELIELLTRKVGKQY